MPGFDGTGPLGYGPATGWGRGNCAFSRWTGFSGFGRGRGWRNMYYATGLPGWARAGYGAVGSPLSKEEQIKLLENEARNLQTHMETISKQLDELRKE